MLLVYRDASQISNVNFCSYLASRFNGIRHFLMIGGLLVALLGGVLIFVLPDSNRIGRLLWVSSFLNHRIYIIIADTFKRLLSTRRFQCYFCHILDPTAIQCGWSYQEDDFYVCFLRQVSVSFFMTRQYLLMYVWAVTALVTLSGLNFSSSERLLDISPDSRLWLCALRCRLS
jgi:hypothetical protein